SDRVLLIEDVCTLFVVEGPQAVGIHGRGVVVIADAAIQSQASVAPRVLDVEPIAIGGLIDLRAPQLPGCRIRNPEEEAGESITRSILEHGNRCNKSAGLLSLKAKGGTREASLHLMSMSEDSTKADGVAPSQLLHIHNAGVLIDRSDGRIVGRDSGIAVEADRRKNFRPQEGREYGAKTTGLRQSSGTRITDKVIDPGDAVTKRRDQSFCGHVCVAGHGV